MKTIISIKWTNGEKSLALLTIFLLISQILLSNTLPLQFRFIAKPATFLSFLSLGYNQFTSTGLSHLFFAASFFLLCPKTDDVVKQTVAFTAGFLLTGWLTVSGVIATNAYILDSLVLLSVFFIALENIFARKLKIENTRYLFLLFFGLVHGAAFGNTLFNTGVATGSPIFSFFSYAAGLMLGEITILALMFLIAGKFLSDKSYYKQRVVNPLSVGLAVYSIYNLVKLVLVTN